MGRAIVTFILTLIAVGVLVGIGAEIYQAGVVQGVIDAGRFPVETNVPVAGYGGHRGFDFLGLLFPILFLFLLFGLIRAAVSGGRGWGHGRHGYGRGYGWGPGWDKGEGAGDGGPSSWREERDRRMADMHRRLHESESGATGTSGADPAPGSGNPAPR